MWHSTTHSRVDIFEDLDEEQTLWARKGSLIHKRKKLKLTIHKLTRVEKRVHFHGQSPSKHLKKEGKQNKVSNGNLNRRMVCNKLLSLIEA